MRMLPCVEMLPQQNRGVAIEDELWAIGQVITIKFLDGSFECRSAFRAAVDEVMSHVNLKLRWVTGNIPAMLRVSFESGEGCWSYVGTHNLEIGADKPTLNLGWLAWALSQSDTREAKRVCQHEFCHALGLKHEQHHPQHTIPWHREALCEYLAKYGWSKDDVAKVYFDTLPDSRHSAYDALSIMHYPVADEFTQGDYVVPFNFELSQADKEFLRDLYPQR